MSWCSMLRSRSRLEPHLEVPEMLDPESPAQHLLHRRGVYGEAPEAFEAEAPAST